MTNPVPMSAMVAVESSNISALGYDGKTKTLVVEFRNSGKPTKWAYFDVSEDEYHAVLGDRLEKKEKKQHSIGSTFSRLIRGVKRSQRVMENANV